MSIHVRNILNKDILEVQLYNKDNNIDISSSIYIKESLNFALSLYHSKKQYVEFVNDLDNISKIKSSFNDENKSFQEVKEEVKTICRKFANKYQLSLVEIL
jgi:DNA helicase TIP49 (TBP-interacting protein)